MCANRTAAHMGSFEAGAHQQSSWSELKKTDLLKTLLFGRIRKVRTGRKWIPFCERGAAIFGRNRRPMHLLCRNKKVRLVGNMLKMVQHAAAVPKLTRTTMRKRNEDRIGKRSCTPDDVETDEESREVAHLPGCREPELYSLVVQLAAFNCRSSS